MDNHYQLYGIGNAIVDLDFEISEETLSRLNIEKGLMTLIDLDRHNTLLEELDGVKHIKACGGSCANTLIAFSQFGGNGFYSCQVADDNSGHFFLQDLKHHGIGTTECALASKKSDEGATGKCLVLITPDADRTMNTYLGISEKLCRNQIDINALKQAQYLYLEGYLVTSETAKDTAIYAYELAKAAQVKTAISLSDPNMTRHFRSGLIEMIGEGVDFLFCNENEALSFCETTQLSDAIEALKKYAKQFAITQGAKGSLIYDGEQIIEISAKPCQAIDTVGAGDMYAAGILYGLTHAMPLSLAGHLGSLAAAAVVQKYGPRLTLHESDKILKAFHEFSKEQRI